MLILLNDYELHHHKILKCYNGHISIRSSFFFVSVYKQVFYVLALDMLHLYICKRKKTYSFFLLTAVTISMMVLKVRMTYTYININK